MSKLQRLAELQNAKWQRSGKPDRSARSAGDATAPLATEQENRTAASSAYLPLGEQSAPVHADRMYDFCYLEATAIGGALIVRFRWVPDADEHEYLLLIPVQNPETVDLDGGGVEVFEQIMFRVVDRPDWQRDATRLTPTLSLLLP